MGSTAPLLEIFLEFLKIGLFLFGGGYGGLALLHKELVELRGWISDKEFVDILGIAESTPGPVAVNSATYVGYKLGGLPGSIVATVGVVLPPYVVILLIAAFLRPYMTTDIARVVFRGINAAVVALILYALLSVGRAALTTKAPPFIDIIATAIFVTCFFMLWLLRIHPIYVIALSAAMSMLIYMIAKL
jgi:chromate transporter